ncbi:hypothetical protein HK097_004539 [Rhizophlyctis rosea]|uniref:Uncharacterized protein n=1 Tax=Rhizophlyctis rosea TaxID=64517 RepID=A0AAD5S352_9FUNG|nr:hypothetical protein HK097_004539 [Rhizophlyctis rosea]
MPPISLENDTSTLPRTGIDPSLTLIDTLKWFKGLHLTDFFIGFGFGILLWAVLKVLPRSIRLLRTLFHCKRGYEPIDDADDLDAHSDCSENPQNPPKEPPTLVISPDTIAQSALDDTQLPSEPVHPVRPAYIEPEVLKQCRLAVRAVLHLAEVSPEVAAVASLTAVDEDHGSGSKHASSRRFRGSSTLSQPFPTFGAPPRTLRPRRDSFTRRDRQDRGAGFEIPAVVVGDASTRRSQSRNRRISPRLADVFPETRVDIEPERTDDQTKFLGGGVLNDPSRSRTSMSVTLRNHLIRE